MTVSMRIPLLPLLLATLAGAPLPGSEIEFNRDVKPILRSRCYECHGPQQQMGTLPRCVSALTQTTRTLMDKPLSDRTRAKDPNRYRSFLRYYKEFGRLKFPRNQTRCSGN
jgi:hypothetical protein